VAFGLATRDYQGSPIRVEGELPSLDFEVLDCACRAEQVVSKSSTAEDGKVGVCSILVRDAHVSVSASSHMEPS